jgi:hypothetical protein
MRSVEYLGRVIMISRLGEEWVANIFDVNVTKTKTLKRIISTSEHAVETEARQFIEGLSKEKPLMPF